MTWIVGIDVGGTFTDFFAVDDVTGEFCLHKSPSTPNRPDQAIMSGLKVLCDRIGIPLNAIPRIEHGTTVGTNALIQRTGAEVALITTAGFRDLLEIGRQVRPHMYDLQKDQPAPLVPRARRIEVSERILSTGEAVTPLLPDDVMVALQKVNESEAQACAVCFLFSFLNPSHEKIVGEMLSRQFPRLHVSLSCEVQPEFREYERLSTTVLNAYLQPQVGEYLGNLSASVEAEAPNTRIAISQSSGGLMSIDVARRFPIRTALSGPAAGAMGAVHIARNAGKPNVLTLDVGGTSADVAIIQDYETATTFSRTVAEFPIRLPMVDIETIGAGGGSIAWFDRDGLLKVGPISAGAVPGPACYGNGGADATVTDANLVLGRLSPGGLVNGAMSLDANAAAIAVRRVADRLGLSVVDTAQGIVAIAISNMVRALRSISVERGHDPRFFVLMPFGGAGPLHGRDVAKALGMKQVLVPPAPGILCAQGLVVSDLSEDYVQTLYLPLDERNRDTINQNIAMLVQEAKRWFAAEGIAPDARATDVSVDLRYVGQNFELAIPLPGERHENAVAVRSTDELRTLFHKEHDRSYGYFSHTDPVEIVNVRLKARGRTKFISQSDRRSADDVSTEPIAQREVIFDDPVPVISDVYRRERLPVGFSVVGPAIIEQFDSTSILFPGDRMTVLDGQAMLIEVS